MYYTDSDQPAFDFGFHLLQQLNDIKATLDRSGSAGLVDLIGACIASGINTYKDITDEVTAIGGDHYEKHVMSVLVLGADNGLWVECEDDEYILAL